MKVKLLTIITILTSLGVFWVFAQNNVAQVSLTTPVSQINAGDTFTVTIDVADAVGVYGGSVQMTYDPLLLAVVPAGELVVTPGDLFAAGPSVGMRNVADPAAGIIDYALTLRQPAEPVTGNGVLGTVQFEALADGSVQVGLTEALLLAPVFQEVNGRQIASQVSEMSVQTQNVTVTVGNATNADVPPFVEHSTSVRPAQPLTPAVVQNQPSVSPVLIIGLMFFSLGFLMFMFGVRTFSQLRRYSRA